MRHRLAALLAGAAMLVGLAATPANAATPGIVWEQAGLTVKTPAEWDAIKVVDSAFAHNLPASREAVMKKIAGDCPPKPPAGTSENLCLWNGYSYSGTIWRIPVSWLQDSDGVNAINGISFYGSGINNASKGWWNRTYLNVRLYDNDSCQNSGWYRNLSSDQFAVQDTAADADWENRISSASTIADSGNYCFSTPGH